MSDGRYMPSRFWCFAALLAVAAMQKRLSISIVTVDDDGDCLLYADDILLTCHSVTVMQQMLDTCSEEAGLLDCSFDTVNPLVHKVAKMVT